MPETDVGWLDDRRILREIVTIPVKVDGVDALVECSGLVTTDGDVATEVGVANPYPMVVVS